MKESTATYNPHQQQWRTLRFFLAVEVVEKKNDLGIDLWKEESIQQSKKKKSSMKSHKSRSLFGFVQRFQFFNVNPQQPPENIIWTMIWSLKNSVILAFHSVLYSITNLSFTYESILPKKLNLNLVKILVLTTILQRILGLEEHVK